MRRTFGHVFRRRRLDGSYHRRWYCRWTEQAGDPPRPRRCLRAAGLTRASAEELLDAIEAEQRLSLERAAEDVGSTAALPGAAAAAPRRGRDVAGPAVRREAGRDRPLAGVSPAVLEAWKAVLAPGTMRGRRAALARWAARLGPVPVSSVTPADVQAAVRRMREEGLAASSVAVEVAILSAAFRTMARELRLRLPPNPCRRGEGVSLPPIHANPRPYLHAEDVESFLRSCPPEIRPQVILLADAGLRPGEVLGLLWGEVSLELRALLLRNTKTHQGRTVHLTDRAVEVLAAARAAAVAPPALPREPDPSAPVFTLGERRFRRLFRDAARAARLPRLTLYSFRHGFATGLLQAGQPVSVVRDLLGHRDLRTTDVYLRSLPDNAGSQAIEALARARGAASIRPPSP